LIFEGDEEQQSRIRNVILASFPPTVSNALFARLEQAATTWSEGQKVTAAIVAKPEGTISDAPRIFLHYQDPTDTKLLNSLMSDLRAKATLSRAANLSHNPPRTTSAIITTRIYPPCSRWPMWSNNFSPKTTVISRLSAST
jgi:hypothetical protein